MDVAPNTEGRSCWVTAHDGIRLFIRDHGTGPAVVLLSAWTFRSEAWGAHQVAMADAGCRTIAPDRRGHGRSDDPDRGYDMDTLADDVAAILGGLDLWDVTLVGHSMGAAEAVRYLARHGSARVSRVLLLAPITPCLTRLDDNPNGIPTPTFDALREAITADFPRWLSDNEAPFFIPETSRETRDWIRSIMQSVALPTVLACHRAFTAADLRDDCRGLDRPTLILHGDRDASAPLAITGQATAALIPDCRLTVIEGAPHALPQTHRREVVDAMLACARCSDGH